MAKKTEKKTEKTAAQLAAETATNVKELKAAHVNEAGEVVTLEFTQENGESLNLNLPAALMDAAHGVLAQASLVAAHKRTNGAGGKNNVQADLPSQFQIGEFAANTTDGGTHNMVLMQLSVPTNFGAATRSFAFDADSASRLAEGIKKQAEATTNAAAN